MNFKLSNTSIAILQKMKTGDSNTSEVYLHVAKVAPTNENRVRKGFILYLWCVLAEHSVSSPRVQYFT